MKQHVLVWAWGGLGVFLCSILYAQPNGTEEGPARTVQAAAQRAISTNPQVQAAWHAMLAAEDAKDIGRAGFKPRLDFEAGLGVERQEYLSLNSRQEYEPRRVSLTLSQLLYDGFATSSENHRLDHAHHARRFEFHAAAQTAALDAYRAYQDVNRYRNLVSLAQQNLAYHREIYSQIDQRTTAGVSRTVDLQQASGRLALAESNLLTEFSNLHDVSARYQRIIGEIPLDDLEPAPLLEKGMPVQVLSGLDTAFHQNPEILAASENILASKAAVAGARSRYHPRVDLRLYADYGADVNRINGRSNNQVAEVVLRYNLFNGGADRAAVYQAKDEVDVAKDLRDKACRDVRQELRIAHNDGQRISQQLRYLQQHKSATERARIAYRDQFSIGQRTLLDLLDTENEYFEANRAYVNGNYDLTVAHARTLASMGELLVALELTREGVNLADPNEHGEDLSGACPQETNSDLVAAAWLDSDGDGVPDSRDACPGTPLGVKVDERGCEIVGDDDGDGVLNNVDLCPNSPPGSKVNEVGCALMQHVILKGVDFKVYSAELTSAAQAALNRTAEILLGADSMKVEVAGHTDSSGSSDLNDRLSRQRAESVMRYLIRKGVPAVQLQAKGYGSDQPLASNETAQGRKRNRRVEFRILQQ